ncbi:WD40-repeat-containing domain protein [Phlebopus sp. FC_14]|nr:WD40-repeat-containing domain protein [Phlebopus sp. FC_14]
MNGPLVENTPVVFTTRTAYSLPAQKFMIPTNWKRYQLSQLINKALSLARPIPFDFLIHGEILRTSLGEWRLGKGIGEEDTLEIEYFESVLPPQRMATLPHEDWVSSISCRIPQYFLTSSYDGHVRIFDYSQKLVRDIPAHPAPITSVCLVPTPGATEDSLLIASASHDLTACLVKVSLEPDAPSTSKALASLHLHTLPLSLIGFWDTTIPLEDEVMVESGDRKKRRRVTGSQSDHPKRKSPINVLRSHTGRVSRALFSPSSSQKAYSCGFDSTVRAWDVELGICVHTINVPERPMLDLAVTQGGDIALASSTDRTVSIFDFRSSSLSSTSGTLMHPTTPSCLVCADSNKSQIITGSYDGTARLWDLRSTRGAVASFKAWDGSMKILSVDWVGDVVGVAGEGGVEVWRVGQGDIMATTK